MVECRGHNDISYTPGSLYSMACHMAKHLWRMATEEESLHCGRCLVCQCHSVSVLSPVSRVSSQLNSWPFAAFIVQNVERCGQVSFHFSDAFYCICNRPHKNLFILCGLSSETSWRGRESIPGLPSICWVGGYFCDIYIREWAPISKHTIFHL